MDTLLVLQLHKTNLSMGAKIENGHLVVTTKSVCGAAELEMRMQAITRVVGHSSAHNLSGEDIYYLMNILEDMLPDEKQIKRYLGE